MTRSRHGSTLLGRGGDTRAGGVGRPMARRTVLTSSFNRRAISLFGTSSTRCTWRISAHCDILITSASSWIRRRDDLSRRIDHRHGIADSSMLRVVPFRVATRSVLSCRYHLSRSPRPPGSPPSRRPPSAQSPRRPRNRGPSGWSCQRELQPWVDRTTPTGTPLNDASLDRVAPRSPGRGYAVDTLAVDVRHSETSKRDKSEHERTGPDRRAKEVAPRVAGWRVPRAVGGRNLRERQHPRIGACGPADRSLPVRAGDSRAPYLGPR